MPRTGKKWQYQYTTAAQIKSLAAFAKRGAQSPAAARQCSRRFYFLARRKIKTPTEGKEKKDGAMSLAEIYQY